MATPDQPDPTEPNLQTPTQTQTLAIPIPTPTPFPRKLPIKRKQSPTRTDPSPSDVVAADPPTGDVRSPPATGDVRSPQPPFKFQRIWSESDEIRFLQGLLGCKSQGLVFPRDLNLFYDQFSANMPQPYTRSQLSEKLRRLKNKHKSATARIARNGLDPSRITPHDKDVLHLCSRLWDPQNAVSSPFFSTTPGVSESLTGNKRRRANPRPLPNSDDGINTYDDEANEDNEGNFESSSHSVPLTEERAELLDNMLIDSDLQSETIKSPSPSPIKIEASNNNGNKANNRNSVNDGNKSKQVELRLETGDNGNVIANAMLDVFEECLKEIGMKGGEDTGDDAIKKKWRALRVAELDVLARRMRLMIEDATAVAR
ncbi:hypothetical protein LUZ61_001425 [Rhynchospora tenuis]|uniref:Glabrous enhancer-binding protein-like DBD domain-containing protein n=1 Tax=Rhynchospora tenuis TaxID=198213 RepID=A0AAD6EQZ0_9POAL|nr:hypothetical protein LUZ61_001425 [Rhynchospora tenuis]